MAMSDCVKCWSTPCECGHDYRDWTIQRLTAHINMLKAVLADKMLSREEIERSWDGPGGR